VVSSLPTTCLSIACSIEGAAVFVLAQAIVMVTVPGRTARCFYLEKSINDMDRIDNASRGRRGLLCFDLETRG
jgi:hypothetical protein